MGVLRKSQKAFNKLKGRALQLDPLDGTWLWLMAKGPDASINLLGSLNSVEVSLGKAHGFKWLVFQDSVLERLAIDLHHLQAFFLEFINQLGFTRFDLGGSANGSLLRHVCENFLFSIRELFQT
jgi:hypothetical protein